MTRFMIDGAQFYEVLEALDYNHPCEAHKWAWGSAVEVTAAIMCAQKIVLSPVPGLRSAPSGQFGQLLAKLSGIVDLRPESQLTAEELSQVRTSRDRAIKQTQRWALSTPSAVANALQQTKNESSFKGWLDWHQRNQWAEHATRLDGLFDRHFLPQLSVVLNVPPKDIEELWMKSRDPEVAKEWGYSQPNSSWFGLVSDAYVASTLLRGRYYDNFTVAAPATMRVQALHHPMRRHARKAKMRKVGARRYQVPNVLWYLANLIMGSAFQVPRRERLDTWTKNVKSVHAAHQKGVISLDNRDTENEALEAAVQIARTLRLQVHSKYLDIALNAGIVVGLGVLGAFVLSPWPDLELTLGEAAVTAFLDPGRTVIRLVTAREAKLSELAQAGPGIVQAQWQRDD
jgi:hypothetical protein